MTKATCLLCGHDEFAHIKGPIRDHFFYRERPAELRTPGSTREKSYRQQVLETVWVSLALVGLGLIGVWMHAWAL